MTVAAMFLASYGWEKARAQERPADFSTRRFARLERSEGEPRRAILMQAAPDQRTAQFVAMSGLLRRCGLSAPEVYAADSANGLVLMEDFGDTTFGALLDDGLDPLPLYRRAVDGLVTLHKTFEPAWTEGKDLPNFTTDVFVKQAELFLDCYFPYVHKRVASEEEREGFQRVWRDVLTPIEDVPQTLMLRDYMPDNIMHLSEREGVKRTGLIDFQDGGIGPLAYDLASLGESVRRDVSLDLLDEILIYYHSLNPVVPFNELRKAAYVLAAQRHVRILGILARLANEQGRTDKLAPMPRVRAHVAALLVDEALGSVRHWFDGSGF
jgi:aminoglycoside/choline kinase family phosphotransferase